MPKVQCDLKYQLFYPVLPADCDTTLADGSTLASKLDEWRIDNTEALLAQLIAPPIGRLLVQGLFSTTIALARSSHIEEVFDADVFSADWVHSSHPVHAQVT